jgi:hypothetical protein
MKPPIDIAAPRVPALQAEAVRLASWPLLVGVYVYGLSLSSENVLKDGDTYWHIAAGRWILEHRAVPAADPFSHTMPGASWTAHEWLSEVLLAGVHDFGGWTAVIAVTALAFALAMACLARALLRTVEPTRAVLFTAVAVMMTIGHFLARPHVLAMPLLVVWTAGLVRARQEARRPALWLLPVLALWANMHAGFVLGICLAAAFALEAVLEAWPRGRARVALAARDWGFFVALAAVCGLLTPHGVQGYVYTWEVMSEHQFALDNISEWLSPNFHGFQPLEVWLIGGLAIVLTQGLKLPWLRLVLVLGLLHLALKHARNIELVGMLTPLIVAQPFAAQWAAAGRPSVPSRLDRISRWLAPPAHPAAVAGCILLLAGATLTLAHWRPVEPPEFVAPQKALQAAKDYTRQPVLNGYGWGGYLIYSGIRPFIDGRADMYGDAFYKRYIEAVNSHEAGALEKLLADYRVTWTLLPVGTPAIAVLDHLPGWRRLYADEKTVVHVRTTP